MSDDLLLRGDVVFDAKPDAVPYNYRISYKVSQLCLIIRLCCRQGSCSLVKLHMISTALCTRESMRILKRFAQEDTTEAPIVRFDPAVNRALTYAVAYGFILQMPVGTYKLTESGRKMADQIKMAGDLLVSEIVDLTELSTKLTESKVKQLTDCWRGGNAAN